MRLWRLSGKRHARLFDGGYGTHFNGRWNTIGHPVTYCATSPSLCVLEKLVHIEDPILMPELVMVGYELPDSHGTKTVTLDELPINWRHDETLTQEKGDGWLEAVSTPLLKVPSAIVPIAGSPDTNVLINHNHPDAAMIRISIAEPFVLDARLYNRKLEVSS
jgi:RES domain-containing protein